MKILVNKKGNLLFYRNNEKWVTQFCMFTVDVHKNKVASCNDKCPLFSLEKEEYIVNKGKRIPTRHYKLSLCHNKEYLLHEDDVIIESIAE